MIRKLPLDNVVLKAVTCLSSVRRFVESSVSDVEVLARELHCDEETVLHLVDEWKVYQTEDGLSNEYERIDHYWRNIFSMKMEDGKIKYKCLPELVMSALILPHGNADFERSLSVITKIVTEDRPHIGEATVCAIRTVKDAVEFFDPVSKKPQKVPLTRKLLRSVKMAYASYRRRQDRDKEEKERQLKQQELAKAEKKRLEREREEEDKRTTSKRTFRERV